MLPEHVSIRSGCAEDVRAIAAIERAANPHPWSLNQFLTSSMRASDDYLVLEDQQSGLIGFCVFQQVLDEATLLNIAVLPGVQGAGLGSQLLLALLETLRKRGARRCLLEVRESNSRAIRLYRAQGFLDDGIRRDYYPGEGGREDALLMSCELVSEL